MKKVLARVLFNGEISPSYYRIGLECGEIPGTVLPGQFLMVRPWSIDRSDPLLNRPFGVYRVMEDGGGLEILYRVVGRGTEIMAHLRPGDEVMLLGPLGRGFPLRGGWSGITIVSGGVGIAPFFHLVQWIRRRGGMAGITLYHGGKGRDDLVCLEDFTAEGVEVRVATEDGSVGFKGLISEYLERDLEEGRIEPPVVLTCGPKGMVRAVAGLCIARGIPCYVSLDRMMGCGIGTCLGCVVKTKGGYRRVCVEGPVFEAGELLWEEL